VLSADTRYANEKVFFGYFFSQRTKSDPLAAGQRKLLFDRKQKKQSHWIPACAGMTSVA